ncbi:PIN domain-containing protein [candidate division CSSED10-310 bacterium]|uniref:Ribonuclease VapC n=1 Tax=candidate division CSSED10-310 bacterium TaxID=2855610 RepID=A0ABV6Z432_UNCC1
MLDKCAFIDTNLFLRFITNDVPEKADAVENLLKAASSGEINLLTNEMVIAEIVWTLESQYKVSRAQIKESVLAILNTPGIIINNDDTILHAISWYAEKNIDFIDAYNAAWMLSHNVSEIFTFDIRHFDRIPDITSKNP